MGHHSSEKPLADRGAILRALDELRGESPESRMRELHQQLGATGEYPDGQYGPNDEGELRYAVGSDPDECKVLIDFGKAIRSIGMHPEQARELAASLRRHADRAEDRSQ